MAALEVCLSLAVHAAAFALAWVLARVKAALAVFAAASAHVVESAAVNAKLVNAALGV